jgi:predicted GIY-YIG superfamily endonuclease
VVYLIHFGRAFGHARHYLGYCRDDGLSERLTRHREGRGARLLAAVQAAGIGWDVVRVWPAGGRDLERRLKWWHKSRELCPVCRENEARKRLWAGKRAAVTTT